MWLLGSSMYSAHLAAAKGLPYVFAHHFSGQGTEEALAIYRSEFVPSDLAAEPVTFLTVNAAVAANARRGRGIAAAEPADDGAAAHRSAACGRSTSSRTPQAVQLHAAGAGDRRLRACAAPSSATRPRRPNRCARWPSEFDVDEVMVNPVASAHRGTDPATAPAREKTLELLAKELF